MLTPVVCPVTDTPINPPLVSYPLDDQKSFLTTATNGNGLESCGRITDADFASG